MDAATQPSPALRSPLPFTPRLPPLAHQARYLDEDARRAAFGLIWDPGTGKSKSYIDNLALLTSAGEVHGGFVLAPNGPHRGWHVDQLPEHWPEDAGGMVSFAWDSQKAGTLTHKRDFERFLSTTSSTASPRLPVGVLCMSYDALMTDAGKQASWEFVRGRRAFYAGDESQRFKDPSAKRTKRVIASSVYAPYRRIMSGTPMDKPFDVYSQVRFLDADFWVRELAIGSYASFKATFAEWRMRKGPGGREFPDLVSYRNLDLLQRTLARITSRVEKSTVMDLPKAYKPMSHPLSADQRRVYDTLKSEALALLESGELVTVQMALVLHMRLTQIGCGFIKPAAGAQDVPFRENPRGALYAEVLSDLTRPVVSWGRFRHDVSVMREQSLRVGRRPVVFGEHGDDGTQAIADFKAGRANNIIATLSSNMREFYTLTEADTAVYYANAPGLIPRQQSEDRIYRIGQDLPVTIIDLYAERTLDRKTMLDLHRKQVMSDEVWGSDPRAWLREALDA